MLSSFFPAIQVNAAKAPESQLLGLDNYVVELTADPPTSARPSSLGTATDDGRIWADKSVSVNGDQFDTTLSVLAQEYVRTTTTTGVKAQAAADVAFVLDMSSSMTQARVEAMRDAVNKGIEIIMSANPRNRVGIYYYYGEAGVFFPLASYSLPETGDGNSPKNRYITSQGTTLHRKEGITQTFLDGTTTTTSALDLPRGSSTGTQLGIYTAISDLISDIGTQPLSSLDTERSPYVLLLTDGEANKAKQNWYNYPPDGTSVSTSTNIAALTILTAAKLKDDLKAAYSAHSGNKEVVWFNVGLGLSEGNNLATALLKPSLLATDTRTNLKNVYTELGKYTTNASPEYKKYGVNGTPGYLYATEYIYFVSDSSLGLVSNAFEDLAKLVEASTQEKIIPFEQIDASGQSLDFTINDVLGADMELKSAPKLGSLEGTIKSIDGSISTYEFKELKTTVVYNSDTREVTWVIPPSEIPLIAYADRKSPKPGEYENANLAPLKLTYSVGPVEPYTSEVLYSSEYTDLGDVTTTTFIPNIDNPYYYNMVNSDGEITFEPKAIQSVLKSSNISDTSPYSKDIEWEYENDGNVLVTRLGNNGKLSPKLKIEISPTSNSASAGGKVEYNIIVTNLTQSDIGNIAVNSVLPNDLTFVNGSMKEDGVAKSQGIFPYTIGNVAAEDSVVLTFEAEVSPSATEETEYTTSATITSLEGTTLATPATTNSDGVTVVNTFSASVTTKLDGTDYVGQNVELWQDGANAYTLIANGAVYSASDLIPGIYDIYIDGINTGLQLSNLDANKVINYYSVSFFDGAQKYDEPATQKVIAGGNAVLPTTPSKEGYQFDQWVTTVDGGTAFDFSSEITEATKIYATWIPNSDTAYQVHHYQAAVDGSYDEVTPIVETLYGTTGEDTEAVAQTYTGFTAGAVTQKKIAADGSTVVKIYYEREQYDIAFVVDPDKGSVTSGDVEQQVPYEGTPTEPTVSGTPGYSFTGWDTAVDVITGDQTYTAQFELVDFTLTYDLDGGSVATDNRSSYTVESETFELTNPEKQGYTFGGWTGTELSEATMTVSIEQGSTGDRTYQATWIPNSYTVILDDNGGSGGSDSVTVTYDQPMPTASVPVRPGYTFIGYFDQISDGNKYYNSDMSSANDWDKIESPVTLYAVWTEFEHVTINYESNNTEYGQVSSIGESLNPVIGTAVGSDVVESLGYRFVEWQDNNHHTVSTDRKFIPQKVEGSYIEATYTAVFEAEVYNATYNLEGGTVTSSNPVTYTIEDDTFILTNPTKLGYTFEGWIGSGLSEPTMSVEVKKGSTGDIAYTATWKVIETTGDYIVTGTVIDDELPANEIEGATVQIFKGNTQYGTTAVTDSEGIFIINDVPGGTYNIKITLDEKTAIQEIIVGGSEQVVDLGSLILPFNASSGLKLIGNGTPPIIIDNLHPEAVDYLLNDYTSVA